MDYQESAIKKAYEISYALFRVAGTGLKRPYAEQLEGLALSILGNAASLKFEELAVSLDAANYVLRLGGDVGLISNQHKDILLREIAVLDKMVAESGKKEKLPDLDIAGLFSQDESGKSKSGTSALRLRQTGKSANPVRSREDSSRYSQRHAAGPRGEYRDSQHTPASNEAKRNNPAKSISGNPAINSNDSAKEVIEEDRSGLSAQAGNVKERHDRIAGFIRQSGNCRLKDIHDALPDSSERTIRYDLQALMEEGVVERIGGGGPSTYYRLRQIAATQGGASVA